MPAGPTILFFGSFNPMHNGHTSVARYVLRKGYGRRVWFVVSPQNPQKPLSELAPDTDRLAMVETAVKETLASYDASACDIEFSLPRPSYTIDTLRALSEKYPDEEFVILIGSDLASRIAGWKEAPLLLEKYSFLIYPREGYPVGDFPGRYEFLTGASRWNYSSTDIRNAVSEGESVDAMVAPGVAQYIKTHGLYGCE